MVCCLHGVKLIETAVLAALPIPLLNGLYREHARSGLVSMYHCIVCISITVSLYQCISVSLYHCQWGGEGGGGKGGKGGERKREKQKNGHAKTIKKSKTNQKQNRNTIWKKGNAKKIEYQERQH